MIILNRNSLMKFTKKNPKLNLKQKKQKNNNKNPKKLLKNKNKTKQKQKTNPFTQKSHESWGKTQSMSKRASQFT